MRVLASLFFGDCLVSRGYVAATIGLIALLVVWFAVQERFTSTPGVVGAATDTVSAEGQPITEDAGRSIPEIAGLVAIVVLPLGALVLIIRLQRRRRAAFREAMRHQKQEARAAELASREELDR